MKRSVLLLLLVALWVSPVQAEVSKDASAPILSVAAEGSHALALDARGRVWAWGSNQRGESVPGSAEPRATVPTPVMENAVAIACGQQFSLALCADGRLYGWGDNRSKQLPGLDAEKAEEITPILENIARVHACDDRAIAVTADGKAYLWGGGGEMRIVSENALDARVGADCLLILTENGDAEFLGSPDYYENGVAPEAPARVLTDCASVSASGQTLIACTNGGEIFVWGANGTDGRLGLSQTGWIYDPTKLPIENALRGISGLSCSAALTESRSLYVWGTLYSYVTAFGENGGALTSLVDGTLIFYGNEPILLYENALDIAFGDAFAVLLLSDGSVLTWGSNDQGQIGDGTHTETELVAGEDSEDEDELVIVSSEQRIFPVYLMNLNSPS